MRDILSISGAFLLLLFSIYIASIIHESGHFLGGLIGRLPIKSVSIGTGKNLIRWLIKDLIINVNLFPGGNVKLRCTTDEYFSLPIWSRLFLTLGGCIANITIALSISFLLPKVTFTPHELYWHWGPISNIIFFIKMISGHGEYGFLYTLMQVNIIIASISLLPIVKIDFGNAMYSIVDLFYPDKVPLFLRISHLFTIMVSYTLFILLAIDILKLIRIL